jgi:nucleoid DNA-binding protein
MGAGRKPNVGRKALAAAVATRFNMNDQQALGIIDTVLEAIGSHLVAGEDVCLPKIGTFCVVNWPEVKVPRGRKVMIVPARRGVRVRVSRCLKATMAEITSKRKS